MEFHLSQRAWGGKKSLGVDSIRVKALGALGVSPPWGNAPQVVTAFGAGEGFAFCLQSREHRSNCRDKQTSPAVLGRVTMDVEGLETYSPKTIHACVPLGKSLCTPGIGKPQRCWFPGPVWKRRGKGKTQPLRHWTPGL